MITKTIRVSGNPNLNDEYSALPLEVIPNYMGINLCAVESVTWTMQDDFQLVDLTIKFIPDPKET